VNKPDARRIDARIFRSALQAAMMGPNHDSVGKAIHALKPTRRRVRGVRFSDNAVSQDEHLWNPTPWVSANQHDDAGETTDGDRAAWIVPPSNWCDVPRHGAAAVHGVDEEAEVVDDL